MADIGYVALLLALVAAVYAAGAFVVGARTGHQKLATSARNGVLSVFGLISLAVAIMVYALVTHKFQIEYVASYSSSDLSLPYLLSALWAGNKGSLLFWAWLLSLFAMLAMTQKRDVGRELVPLAMVVAMVTQAFFLLLLLLVSNPFDKLSFTPIEGRGLNPLLENPGMIIHPPLLLAGYVGLTIPFAFAVAALATGRLGDEWIRSIRRWTLVAWLFLGVGNVLGAWWAYVELGWGGYWAWDPVENAGIMPWLVSTAFLHSIMMQRRRGMLKVWNMVLIILSFSLAIFGTFLTRSGIISSVHTFGESSLGPFFLVFLGVTLIGSLGLVAYRSQELKSEAEMESLLSRESTFMLNNLLLVVAAFAVFLGTIFPVLAEAVVDTKITVGPPFFNAVDGPIFVATILLAGICTLIGWRRASARNFARNFAWPLAGAVVLGIVLVLVGVPNLPAVGIFAVCGFVLLTVLSEWWRGTRARHRISKENYARAFVRLIGANRPRYGGYIVHVAILLMALGVVGSSVYGTEQEATLRPGESMAIGKYSLRYDDIDVFETQSKKVATSTLSVYNGMAFVGKLTPQKYFHNAYEQSVTEVAIRSTLAEDLYVIPVTPYLDNAGNVAVPEDRTSVFKVVVNPLVSWIWIGGIVLLAGGLVALWPDRRTSLLLESTKADGG